MAFPDGAAVSRSDEEVADGSERSCREADWVLRRDEGDPAL